jgi:hypothetical protein
LGTVSWEKKWKEQTGLFSEWLTDWEWGALFLFQSHLLWSPSFFLFYFSGWDPYWLKVTKFFWLCATMSLSCSSPRAAVVAPLSLDLPSTGGGGAARIGAGTVVEEQWGVALGRRWRGGLGGAGCRELWWQADRCRPRSLSRALTLHHLPSRLSPSS